ncbi:CopG family ribbon-helix-helix protein [Streptomyces sp. NPDC051554]|uniref:CopG family ribbon-helix-helix protein n=1 Tax=Streptomyces sp. NPDC051554 TaxID=3365656 RepID=UPI0037A20291
MHQPTSRPRPQPHHPHLHVDLDPALRQALDDLADATGRPPEDLVRDAVGRYLDEEGALVRAAAGRLAVAHAGLLRRLGE